MRARGEYLHDALFIPSGCLCKATREALTLTKRLIGVTTEGARDPAAATTVDATAATAAPVKAQTVAQVDVPGLTVKNALARIVRRKMMTMTMTTTRTMLKNVDRTD